jgi:hypothetical protein
VSILTIGDNLLNSPLFKTDSANGFLLFGKGSSISPASQFVCWISMVFDSIKLSKSR